MPSFTDDELLQMTVLAAERIDVGLWKKIERRTGEGYDRVLIWMPCANRAYYKIERDASGGTYLLWCAPDSWRLLVTGTFDECLSLFQIPAH
jgi:hypothetical protein